MLESFLSVTITHLNLYPPPVSFCHTRTISPTVELIPGKIMSRLTDSRIGTWGYFLILLIVVLFSLSGLLFYLGIPWWTEMSLALGSGITTGTVIYSLSNLRSKKETDLTLLLDTSREGYNRHVKCMGALLAKIYSIQDNPITAEERAVYARDFADNAAEFEQVGIRLSELEGYDIYNSDELKKCLETLHPAFPDVIKQASAIETQNNAVLAMREFDNITRPLKNILMLTLRHSDVELQRLRKKLI